MYLIREDPRVRPRCRRTRTTRLIGDGGPPSAEQSSRPPPPCSAPRASRAPQCSPWRKSRHVAGEPDLQVFRREGRTWLDLAGRASGSGPTLDASRRSFRLCVWWSNVMEVGATGVEVAPRAAPVLALVRAAAEVDPEAARAPGTDRARTRRADAPQRACAREWRTSPPRSHRRAGSRSAAHLLSEFYDPLVSRSGGASMSTSRP